MTLLEIFLIGIGLSMDAFAVAVCKGLAMPDKVHTKGAFLIALYFGVFQAVMPTLGWLLGSQFAHYVTKLAPWIAFALLAWIGGNMIRESRAEEKEEDGEAPDNGQVKHRELFVLALATSIDALAVGITFSMVELAVSVGLAHRLHDLPHLAGRRICGQCVRREVQEQGGVRGRRDTYSNRRQDTLGALRRAVSRLSA